MNDQKQDRPRNRRRVIVAVSAIILGVTAFVTPATATAAVGCSRAPHLTGSFIQPWLPDTWSPSTWNTEMGYLTNACITQQIIQSTADTQALTTVYPTSLPGYTQNSSTDVVGNALTAADAAGVQEYVGLQDNADWWANYANNATWLSNEATKANQIADELWSNYGGHSSFAGWYLTFEVDNVNMPSSTTWNRMASFYSTVANHLHSISGKPVAIAPFFNASTGLTPAQWQTMWTSILATAPIDIVAPQDGVGVGHATAADLPAWFSATKSAIAAARPSTQLLSDTETFTGSTPVPMPIPGVVTDMKAVQPYVTGFWSFSYDHYDSPMQVNSSFDTAYRQYLVTG